MKKEPLHLNRNSSMLYKALVLLFFTLVTIQGVEAQITCPPDVTVECGDPIDPTALGFAIADSGGPVTFVDISSPDCPNTAVIERVWTTLIPVFPFLVTCTQEITVEDTTPPTIICAPPQTIECGDPVVFGMPMASDGCDPNPPVITFVDASVPGCGNTEVITRTWTATDACNNATTCEAVITTEDTTAPIVSCTEFTMTFNACPDDILPNVPSGDWLPIPASGIFQTAVGGGTFITDININHCVTDNCSDFEDMEFILLSSVEENRVPGCSVDIINTYGIRDGCENEAVNTITSRSTIQFDGPAPVITCPADVTVECGNPTDPAATGMATATISCGTATITFEDSSVAGCGNTEVITRTWTATDACGNTASDAIGTCVQTITVEDTTLPVIATTPGSLDQVIDITTQDACPNGVSGFVCYPQSSADFPLSVDVTLDGTFLGNFAGPDAADVSDNCVLSDITCVLIPLIIDTSIVVDPCQVVRVINWFGVDECGNQSLPFAQTFTINDLAAPEFTCPPTINVECEAPAPYADLAAFITAGGMASDFCGLDDASFALDGEVSDGHSCPETITRTYSVADDCGNVSTCEQTIIIEDVTQPVAPAAPADEMVQCAADVPAPVDLTAVDNCDGHIIVSPTVAITSGACANDFVEVRTWTFVDACGNESSVSQTITVNDDTAPVAPTAPADEMFQCAADVSSPVDLTGVDNCDGHITVSPTVAITPGACANDFVEVRTWTFVDACGNESSVSQTITVSDDTAPVPPAAPADEMVQCAADVPALMDLTAMDNCDGDITVSPTVVTTLGACANDFVEVRTWTFVDVCGNESSVSQTITVNDNTAPVAPAAPADEMVQCEADIPAPVDLTAVDNCDGDITVSPTILIAIDTSITPKFIEIRTWTFVDICGNESSVSQSIIVNDDTAPVPPTAPAAEMVQCAADVPAPMDLTAVDNCDGDITVSPTIVITPGACVNDFVEVRTWTFVDECGNESSVSQTITVNDDTAPVASAPADVMVQCAADVPGPIDLTAVDNCDGDITVSPTVVITPGTCVNEFVEVRTWTFVDVCGNVSSVSQTITVNDDTAPVATAPADVMIQCATDVPASMDLTAVDNCDGDITVSPTIVITPGACVNEFVEVRTWTFIDVCGNESSVSQTITVNDDTAPVAPAAPADEMIQCATDVPAPVDLTAVDNCDGDITVSPTVVTIPGACANQFVEVRTWTFIDVCGNESSVSQTITVNDDTAPVTPTAPADVMVQCAADVPAPVDLTAVDNCDGDITVSPSAVITPGACANQFVEVRTWTFVDVCGNESSVSQTITVNDDTAPVAPAAPADELVQCATDVPAPVDLTAVDNCDGDITVSPTVVTTPGACANQFVEVRTWTFIDVCGNESSVSQTITVNDDTAPVITCVADVTIECDEDSSPANTGMSTATDNCAPAPTVTFSDVSTQGMGCGEFSFIIIRTWLATDDCGNTATCSQTITVEDNNPPTITVPADVTVECDQPTDPGATGNATASMDNCAADNQLTVTFSDVSTQEPTGCGNDTYMITRTWVASDPCGNTASDIQVIMVEDTTPPTIVCPADLTIECDEDTSPANTGTAVAVDACAPEAEIVITFTDVSTQTATGCGQYQYVITRTWTATDPCGNAMTCVQIIEVEDTTAPEIVCPADVSLSCTDSTDPADTGIATGSDNCSTVAEVIITSTDISTQTNEGCGQFTYEIFRTWLATDACGNTTTCVQNIAVADTEAPVITCPADQTLSCFETVPAPLTTAADFIAAGGTISDNCTVALTDFTVISQNDDNGGDNCPGNGRTIVRTYFVADACGNTSSCEQTFTYLESTQGPVITSVLPACYKYCASLANPMESDVTFDTDCSFGGTVSIAGPTQIGQDNCPGSIYRYTYTVVDDCGRTSAPVTRDFIIGNDGPTIECAPFNLLLECGDPNNSDYIADHIGTVTANTSCELGYTINYFPQNFNNITCNSSTVVTFVATDDCGRTASCTTTINISDNTAPVITSTYVDGVCNEAICGSNVNFWFNEWKEKVLEGLTATDACDSNVSFTTSGPNSPNQNCPDGMAETVITFVANDNCGNTSGIDYSFYVVPADEPTTGPSIMGMVATEQLETVENVSVTLEGNSLSISDLTAADGMYGFEGLVEGQNYSVTPLLDENPLNGVTSYDLVLMSKHILQLEALDSPYKIIAADVNNSGSVTTLDLVELRKLILHIDENFANNTSWRFVEAAYVFPVPTNPFASTFPEEVFINGLTADEQHDFVGVKVGDVNNSAIANQFVQAEDRTNVYELLFKVKDQALVAGETYEVSFEAANFNMIHGYQFTLNFDERALAFKDVSASDLAAVSLDNFGLRYLEEGQITTSWTNKEAVSLRRDAKVFTLSFIARKNVQLSEVLSINSRYTKAEAYNGALELMNVGLRFEEESDLANGFRLHQNTPNPFHQETSIGFELPEAGSATLSVYDATGILLLEMKGDYAKGFNTIAVSSDRLTAGLLYYELVSANHRGTRKMILN